MLGWWWIVGGFDMGEIWEGLGKRRRSWENKQKPRNILNKTGSDSWKVANINLNSKWNFREEEL
jgi:hypothetical protein